MMVVDIVLKPIDSYWKKQYTAEKIRRQRAEANEKYASGMMEEQQARIAKLKSEAAVQDEAIEALNKEVLRLKGELADALKTIDARDEKISVLWEALHAERDARQVMKTNGLLWEQLKRETVGDPSTSPDGSAQDDNRRRGVYIKDMEMPSSCPCELLGIGYDLCCSFTGGIPARVKEYYECCQNDTRPSWCPLVPVPPHVDLIGREWLIDIALHLMNTAKNDDVANGVKWLWQYIIDAPTIIPAEEGE